MTSTERETIPEELKSDTDPVREPTAATMAVPVHGSDADSTSPTPSQKEQLEEIKAAEEFKPTLRFKLAFVSLAILTLMVALDATSISVALPVCRSSISSLKKESLGEPR